MPTNTESSDLASYSDIFLLRYAVCVAVGVLPEISSENTLITCMWLLSWHQVINGKESNVLYYIRYVTYSDRLCINENVHRSLLKSLSFPDLKLTFH